MKAACEVVKAVLYLLSNIFFLCLFYYQKYVTPEIMSRNEEAHIS